MEPAEGWPPFRVGTAKGSKGQCSRMQGLLCPSLSQKGQLAAVGGKAREAQRREGCRWDEPGWKRREETRNGTRGGPRAQEQEPGHSEHPLDHPQDGSNRLWE